MGSRWLSSVHYGPVTGIIENSHFHERIPRALRRGVDLLLYTLLDLVVDAHLSLLDEIEEEVDSLQDRTGGAGGQCRFKWVVFLF